MKRFPVAVLIGFGGLLGLLVASTATAHTVTYKSDVTIKSHISDEHDHDSIKGRVISDNSSCEADRTVKVYRIVGAQMEDREFIGMDQTDADGRYKVKPEEYLEFGAGYFAKATPKVLQDGGEHLHTCKRALSDRIFDPGPPI